MIEVRAGLLGHPVAHSRSPELFGQWCAAQGVEGRYTLVDVPPDELVEALAMVWEEGWHGLNVTIPHKEAMLRLVDAPASVVALGAVNCLTREPGGWVGANTDAQAVLDALTHDAGFAPRDRHVVILGAGGAARAASHALGLMHHVTVVSRRPATLVGAAQWRHWDEPPLAEAALLINATPIGMAGGPAASGGWEHLPWDDLPPDALVFDMVYRPLKTPLLAEAERRGHPTLDGLTMLRRQGEVCYAKWLDVAHNS